MCAQCQGSAEELRGQWGAKRGMGLKSSLAGRSLNRRMEGLRIGGEALRAKPRMGGAEVWRWGPMARFRVLTTASPTLSRGCASGCDLVP